MSARSVVEEAAVEAQLLSILQALCGYLDVRSLARMGRTCRTLLNHLVDLSSGPLWAAAASQLAPPPRVTSYSALRSWLPNPFDAETLFEATLEGGSVAHLTLGKQSRRVSCAALMLPVKRAAALNFKIRKLVLGGAQLLWIGVLRSTTSPARELNRCTLPAALAGYDHSSKRPVSERFGGAEWEMSAVGCNGACWVGGTVTHRNSKLRYQEGDTVRLQINAEYGTVGGLVNREVPEAGPLTHPLAKRIWPAGASRAGGLYVIVHLTDTAAPTPDAKPGEAVVEVAPAPEYARLKGEAEESGVRMYPP
jgi:hypothetical protein